MAIEYDVLHNTEFHRFLSESMDKKPPDHPPIVEQLSESFVASCLVFSKFRAWSRPPLRQALERSGSLVQNSHEYFQPMPEVVGHPRQMEGIHHHLDS
ncbi:hypothetical protein TNIN_474741 [Trichonephila inaurata madagascariensis]|uniref:Uncharacterized protein n=1 Tax=Trichonephila inaurata madagascariensis TaxID=2747483 RepID=A0A8X6XN84_9ARAC|nr:hypothetical protein TNIN_474741 [Trichonephila inaurata madagascariensis]